MNLFQIELFDFMKIDDNFVKIATTSPCYYGILQKCNSLFPSLFVTSLYFMLKVGRYHYLKIRLIHLCKALTFTSQDSGVMDLIMTGGFLPTKRSSNLKFIKIICYDEMLFVSFPKKGHDTVFTFNALSR